ncbi:MAG: NAD(P)-dependent alcohol dehydrogenase [Rhodothermales bacterium]|nr:NAD(P)-dependent alcohol dehydrogenase [Rhodothermales bacterium]
MTVNAYAAQEAGARLEPFTFELGPLHPNEVEIDVSFCGICHSDLSMLHNHWGMTQYPFVPGHEAIGAVRAVGNRVSHVKVGQTVGIGWASASCMHCEQCMSGNHNLCPKGESTIVGRYGGFADKLRCSAEWAVPLPDGIDAAKAGPLFCGGITVFSPLVEFDVKPTDRVGVIGIGGLGHLALQFMNKWGCEVTAFSSNPAKEEEARSMGAHHVVNSRNPEAISAIAGTLDLILVTVNVAMDWGAYLAALRPKGRLHFVGAVPEPISTGVFPLLMGQKQISASPIGSPATTAKMLEFCARHTIAPVTEMFGLSEVNEALEHLRDGKARYRIVLDASR